MSYTTWADYRLELYDGSRTLLCILDDAVNLRYRRRLFGGGDFSFSLHIQSAHASHLTQTALRYVRIWRRGTCVFDGVIYKMARKYKESGRGLTEYIDVTGVRLGAAVATWRVGVSSTPTGRFTYIGLVDDGFKWLIEKTHGATAYTIAGARAITGFTVAANKSERAGSKTLDATGVNMYEFLDRWGRYYEVDWDITFDASMNFVFETYYPRRGVDRTEDNGVVVPVVMNDAGEELTEVDYFADAVGYCNAVIGETLNLEQIDSAGITTYQRREIVAGTSETEALKILLADKNIHIGYKQGFAETASCQYITAWDVGDLITQNNLHLGLVAADALIVEVVALINKQGQEELTVCYGDYPRGLEDRLRGSGAGGGGGGYGDTPGGKTARLWGLRGDANTWVKPDDANLINVIGGTGMDVTEGTNTLTVTCTLNLGDYVPITRTVTAGAGLTGGGALSGDITLTVGAGNGITVNADDVALTTPGTCTVSSTNSAAGSHTHAITSSAAPGVAASILATDASGDVAVQKLTCTQLYFTAGEYINLAAANRIQIVADGYIYQYIGAALTVFTYASNFVPGSNNAISNGNASYRWSDVYTVLLNHSGTTIVISGITYTPPVAAASGALFCNTSGVWSWANATGDYTPANNSSVCNSPTIGAGDDLYYDATGHVNTSSGTRMYARSGTHSHPLGT